MQPSTNISSLAPAQSGAVIFTNPGNGDPLMGTMYVAENVQGPLQNVAFEVVEAPAVPAALPLPADDALHVPLPDAAAVLAQPAASPTNNDALLHTESPADVSHAAVAENVLLPDEAGSSQEAAGATAETSQDPLATL